MIDKRQTFKYFNYNIIAKRANRETSCNVRTILEENEKGSSNNIRGIIVHQGGSHYTVCS